MPGHYTLKGQYIDYCRNLIDNDSTNNYYSKKVLNIILSHFIDDPTCYKLEDVKCITSDYLIKHIDSTFKIMITHGWFDVISFDIFLEYILPYRFADEPFDLWRDSLKIKSRNDYTGSVKDYIQNSSLLVNRILFVEEKKQLNFSNIENAINIRFSYDCYTVAHNEMLNNRLLGIPSSLHFIPYYSNRNGYHYWIKEAPFYYKSSSITNAYDRRTAKVYQRTYKIVNTLYKNEKVLNLFSSPFIMDVTNDYVYSTNVVFKINDTTKYCYLSIFNNLEWKPIAIAKNINNIFTFESMAKNVVYLPTNTDGMPLSNPFILQTNNKVYPLIPDTTNLQSLWLERKNPDLMNKLSFYYKKLFYCKIVLIKDFNNKRSDTLFFHDKSKFHYLCEYINKTNSKYKFIQLTNTSDFSIDLAELYLYEGNNRIVDFLNNDIANYKNLIDNNPLTNYTIPSKKTLMLQLNKSINITNIYVVPRGDGNGIYPNNEYELLYFNKNKWNSLGLRKAIKPFLEYENIPSNTLLWLRNITNGNEERIFTYKNKLQCFW